MHKSINRRLIRVKWDYKIKMRQMVKFLNIKKYWVSRTLRLYLVSNNFELIAYKLI